VARVFPNLADIEIDNAQLSGSCDAPLAALTRLRLTDCKCAALGAPLRLTGVSAPRLLSVDACEDYYEEICAAVVAGHPTVQELAVGHWINFHDDSSARWLRTAMSLRVLAKLKLCFLSDDPDGSSAFLKDLRASVLQLPPTLRSLDLTISLSGAGTRDLRLDTLLAALGCTVGGRLHELSVILHTIGAADALAAPNPFPSLSAFPQLEALRLGWWSPGSRDRRAPADALALLTQLVQPLAAARVHRPSLRSVELIVSRLHWAWGHAHVEAVAGLVRANPGLSFLTNHDTV
jgi:hypothetical protein